MLPNLKETYAGTSLIFIYTLQQSKFTGAACPLDISEVFRLRLAKAEML